MQTPKGFWGSFFFFQMGQQIKCVHLKSLFPNRILYRSQCKNYISSVIQFKCTSKIQKNRNVLSHSSIMTTWHCDRLLSYSVSTLTVWCVVAVCIYVCFLSSWEWLILKCRLLTECSAIPRGERPWAGNRGAAIAFFSSVPHLSFFSTHLSNPFNLCLLFFFPSLLFLPRSLMALLIGNIDIYGWIKWAAILEVQGVGFLIWVKKRQTCLLIFFEFTAARAHTSEMDPSI